MFLGLQCHHAIENCHEDQRSDDRQNAGENDVTVFEESLVTTDALIRIYKTGDTVNVTGSKVIGVKQLCL